MSQSNLPDSDLTFEEGTTPTYSFHPSSDGETLLEKSDLDALEITYYTVESPVPNGRVINNRLNQDCYDLNGVTIDPNGRVHWTLSEEDTVVLNSTAGRRTAEAHCAEFKFQFDGKTGRHVVPIFIIQNAFNDLS